MESTPASGRPLSPGIRILLWLLHIASWIGPLIYAVFVIIVWLRAPGAGISWILAAGIVPLVGVRLLTMRFLKRLSNFPADAHSMPAWALVGRWVIIAFTTIAFVAAFWVLRPNATASLVIAVWLAIIAASTLFMSQAMRKKVAIELPGSPSRAGMMFLLDTLALSFVVTAIAVAALFAALMFAKR
jgi:hypothetical protein